MIQLMYRIVCDGAECRREPLEFLGSITAGSLHALRWENYFDSALGRTVHYCPDCRRREKMEPPGVLEPDPRGPAATENLDEAARFDSELDAKQSLAFGHFLSFSEPGGGRDQ